MTTVSTSGLHDAVPADDDADRRSIGSIGLPQPLRSKRSVRRPRAGVAFLVGDLVAVVGALTVTGTGWPAWLVAFAVVGAVIAGLGGYRSRLTLSVLDDLPTIAAGALVGAVSANISPASADVVVVLGALVVLLVLGRVASYSLVRQARRRGIVAHRTLVLGAGEVGQRVARAALEHPEHGIVPIGFLDDDPARFPDQLPVPHLGVYADLPEMVLRENISEVIVAWGLRDDRLVETVRECDRLETEIFCVPRLFELHHRGSDTDELWGIPLVRFRRATWRSWSWRVKRLGDVVIAATALILLSPILALAALAVRIELGKSIIYRQVRVGLDGVPFTIYKFRSLSLPETTGDAPVWSINGDARLGPVGRFLRSTSIDELPQLVNVVRGDMSLVGPRPERPQFVDRFATEVPRYHDRHRTPAGLTGLAQVNGLRGDTSIEERARFDNAYIQNWSLWLDLRIMARTVGTVLFRRGS